MMDVDEATESTRTITEEASDSKEGQDGAKNKTTNMDHTSIEKIGSDIPYRHRDLGSGDAQSRHIALSRSLDVATYAMKSWHRKGPVT